jgi:hypothetical protein
MATAGRSADCGFLPADRSPVLNLHDGVAENLGGVLKFIHGVAMGRKREEQSVQIYAETADPYP